MSRPTRHLSLLLVASMLLYAYLGCGSSEPSGGEREEIAVEEPALPATPPETATAEPPHAKAPQTADAAVTTVISGLRENNPVALWEFLPPSYQQDVNDLVREFAERMDEELWSESFATAENLTKLLRDKKDFIVATPLLQQAAPVVDVEQLSSDWDEIVSLLSTLVESELSDIETLRTFDGGAFLAGTGGTFLNRLSALSRLSPDDNPFHAAVHEKLAGMTVTLVSEAEDRATVRLEFADPEEQPGEFEFVRIEGRWIPEEWAGSWEANIEEYRRQMRAATEPEVLVPAKEQGLVLLRYVDEVIEELNTAESAAAFHEIVTQKVERPLVARLPEGNISDPASEDSADPVPPPAVPGSPSEGAVFVIVNAPLDDETEELLQVKLGRWADSSDLGIAIPLIVGEATRFEVSPVADVAAYARRIAFGTVRHVDGQKRIILVELNSGSGEHADD